MGKRSGTATAFNVLVAFIENRGWAQAQLARRVGVGVPALKRLLEELREAGCPLERTEDHPHVYWDLPRDWLPGGQVLVDADFTRVLRFVQRAGQSKERDALLKKLHAATRPSINRDVDAAQPWLGMLEDAIDGHYALELDYLSASKAARTARVVSVHRVEYGRRPRFLATSHSDQSLRTFRVDGIISLQRSEDLYRSIAPDALDAYAVGSMDGYRGRGAKGRMSFTVRFPESKWVERNLPKGDFQIDALADGAIRFSIETTAPELVARYVVGLGDAARIESPALRALVMRLAESAIAVHESPQPELAVSPLYSDRPDLADTQVATAKKRPTTSKRP